MRWVGDVACTGAMRTAYIVLVVKHEGERPFGKLGVERRNASY
jgi:hypothetical protein